jgi:hypothetical protein
VGGNSFFEARSKQRSYRLRHERSKRFDFAFDFMHELGSTIDQVDDIFDVSMKEIPVAT